MSAEILKQLEDLKRELAVEKAVNSVAKYNLEDSVATGLASAIASLETTEQKNAVIKALDFIVAKTDEAVNKALEVEKAAKAEKEENEVLKNLSEEQGHAEKGENVIEKSKLDKIKEETEKLLNKSKGTK